MIIWLYVQAFKCVCVCHMFNFFDFVVVVVILCLHFVKDNSIACISKKNRDSRLSNIAKKLSCTYISDTIILHIFIKFFVVNYSQLFVNYYYYFGAYSQNSQLF
jgi:hypothetical protein